MENDDDAPKKGNTDKRHKPKHSADKNRTPIGVSSPLAPTLGSGSTRILNFEFAITSSDTSVDPTLPAEEPKDTRPVAVLTGDADVDRQSEEDGYQLKSMDDIKEEASKSEPSAETAEDESLVAPRTNDRELNDWLTNEGYTLSPDHAAEDRQEEPYDRPRGTHADLKASFQRAHERGQERQQSKDQELE